MKKIKLLLLIFSTILYTVQAQSELANGYVIEITGFDWGPAVNKIILNPVQKSDLISTDDFEVFVNRDSEVAPIPSKFKSGKRKIIKAFSSDSKGMPDKEGLHITLLLASAPNDPLGSPIQYHRAESSSGNIWIDYKLVILHTPTQSVWNREQNRIIPIVDDFDSSGTYTHEDGIQLKYASFLPETTQSKIPLIIWLHGGGEGGTNPTIPLIANKAYNYASPEIQRHFKGAAVLVPQTPTRWMHGVTSDYTRGQEDDIYHKALMGLIQNYVKNNPSIDSDRIYLGGCSNGGYMTLKLLIENPNYFSAGYISSLAYYNEFITESQLLRLKKIPIWFVHSQDDTVTEADKTATPLFKRLKQIGNKNVHYSLFDHVVDISNQYGGKNYLYNGHWSWVYLHANQVFNDYDKSPVLWKEKPVSIMEWMAAQHR
jgi:predicted esterase